MSSKIKRVKRSKKEAQNNYDRLSRWYDILSSSEKKYNQMGLELLDVQEGETVLEIGCGTGRDIVALAQSVGISGKVYGIDISEGMLKVALSKVEKAEVSGKVVLQQGDAAKLPFDNDFFDAIVMNFILELFDTPEIPLVLNECRRVLHDGGRIGVVALSRKKSVMVNLYELMHDKFPQYIDCRPIYVREALEEAEFEIVDSVVKSMWGLPVEIVVAMKYVSEKK